MKHLLSYPALIIGLSAIFTAPQAQADATIKIDGLNRTVFIAARQAQTISGKRAKTQSAIQKIHEAIVQDGIIDAAEKKLIETLQNESITSITLVGPKDPNASFQNIEFLNHLNPEARGWIAKTPTDLSGDAAEYEQIWRAEKQPILIMLERSKTSEPTRNQIVEFIAAKATADWNSSSRGNGFRPISTFIARHFGDIMNMPDPSAQTEGRQLLSDALELMATQQRSLGKPVPDPLYQFVKPAKSAP